MVEEVKLVTVCEPMSEAEHLVIAGLLESEGIKYYSKNAGVQNLFGVGSIGGGNLITGVIKIQVAQQDLSRAREIIEKASPIEDQNSDNDAFPEDGDPADES